MLMNEQRLRIGFIGAGANTKLRHLPGFKAIPGVELQVVCNRSAESSQRVANEFGIKRIAQQWCEVIDAEDVDAICVGTWPNLHAQISIAALNAGKHVLTEARMAMNVEEAEAMLAAETAHPNLVAQIVPAPMSLHMDATVIRCLTDGVIGQLREVLITHSHGLFANSSAPLSWRQDIRLSGINMLTVGIYYEIVRRWLKSDPRRVLARGKVHTPQRKNENGEWVDVRIPDSISILGEYKNNVHLVAHFSGVEAGEVRDEIRLVGSNGMLRADFKNDQLLFSSPGLPEQAIESVDRRGWQVETDFVDSIRNDTPVKLTSFDEGVRYMRVTQAIRNSYDKGSVWISV